jgi:hypothetical protein
MLRKILSLFRGKRGPNLSVEMSGLESRVLFSVPAAPASLSASSTSSQIKLHWTDKSSNETGFAIYRGTSKTSLSKISAVAKNATSYTQTPPKKGTTYYYTVRAYNSSGNSSAPSAVSAKVSTTSSSTTSSTKTSSVFSGKVIRVGPNESVKSLNSVTFPKAGQTPVEILLDYSSTPYTLSQHYLYGKLTIVPSDSSRRPTIRLGSSYKKQNASTYIAQNPTIMVAGSLTVKNINTVGGTDTIFLGSTSTGNIDAENVRMTDGGAMWLGSGGQNILFKNNDILGKPRKYAYANFNHMVNTLTIDNSGTKVPVQQGGSIVNGQAVGEAAIRIMDANKVILKGITTRPWFYKSGQEWKQDVQLRPSCNLIQVINCNFYQPDVGDMTWRSPAKPIQEVDFIDSHLTKSPNITNGVSTIKFSNTLIGGTKTTKTI